MKKENRILQIATYLGVYTFILASLFIAGNHFIILPLKKVEEELKSAQFELAKMEKMIREVPNPEKNIEEIQKKIEKLKEKAASRRELPRIIQQLTKKSSELGIEIISIRPLEETTMEGKNLPAGVSKAYVEVILKASYKKIGEYLKAIRELPIILTLESLSITKPAEEEIGKGENTLIATLVISSYTVWKI
ncbi:MAG: hypothetical protein DRO87_11830 [Candidatus Thorarchaeota archaeon]|nr:MAG: hypothetical protein DRO87_11830 [Candidatus Thorarchaeota archaeon]